MYSDYKPQCAPTCAFLFCRVDSAKGRLGSSKSYPHSMDLRSVDAPPTAGPTPSESAPLERLSLDWVHGARAHDCRANLHLLASGELLYAVGAFAVVASTSPPMRQRAYREHSSHVL